MKIFFHLSREGQKKRFLERLDDPTKYWKFSASDLAERGNGDEYRAAYEEAISATSTPWAPSYVVPADHMYALRPLVGGLLVHPIDEIDLRLSEVGPDELKSLVRARNELLAE